MANLGSDNTPIKGENFSLPDGAQIDEDNGDFVIRDSGGSIMLRRDEANDAWDFVSTDLKGITSLETDVLEVTNGLVIGKELDSATESDATKIQLVDLPVGSFRYVVLEFVIDTLTPSNGSATCALTVDDNDSNSRYGYIENGGAANGQVNTLQLLEVSGAVRADGIILLKPTQDGIGVQPKFTMPWRVFDRVSSLTTTGGTNINDTADRSVEITLVDADNADLELIAYGVA